MSDCREAPLSCPDCDRRFVDDNALFQHRKWKHRAKADDNPKPPRQHDDNYADLEAAGEER